VRIARQDNPALSAILDGMYRNTQARMDAQGLKEVVLYRGMAGGDSQWAEIHNYPDGSYTTNSNNIHQTVLGVSLNPLTSWSSDKNTAEGFATAQDTGKKVNEVMFTARVPKERVLSCALTGLGCLNEQEFVLIGTDGETTMEWIGGQ